MDLDDSSASLEIHGTFISCGGRQKVKLCRKLDYKRQCEQSVCVWLALCSDCGGVMIDDTGWFASYRLPSIRELTFPLLSVKALYPDLVPFPGILLRLFLKSVLSIVSLEVCSPLHSAIRLQQG